MNAGMGASFSGGETFQYPAHDLDAMEAADKYYDFLIDLMKPYLGRHIVEVGGGRGTFARKLLERHMPASFVLMEPDQTNVEAARSLLSGKQTADSSISVLQGFSDRLWSGLEHQPDTIVYVNVLEHVEKDALEIEKASQALRPGGVIVAFSPAMAVLYSEFDRELGHYRRYSLAAKKQLFTEAGMTIRDAFYLDSPGFFAWFLAFRVFRFRTLKSRHVGLYDRLIFPMVRLIEPLKWIWFGKNVFVVAQK
jgi:SAM-dependent methyltransferase